MEESYDVNEHVLPKYHVFITEKKLSATNIDFCFEVFVAKL